MREPSDPHAGGGGIKEITMSFTAKNLILGLAAMAFSLTAAAADANKMLADRHAARGVPCQACHTQMPPKAPSNEACAACHGGYAQLAKRTAKKDINPHDSHVEDPSCNQCHSGHKKPRLLCDQCHEFTNIKVP